MTEAQGNAQFELFSQSKDPSVVRDGSGRLALTSRIRQYEKSIIIVIALIFACIASFSLGVEKGKRISKIINSPISVVSVKETPKPLSLRQQPLPQQQAVPQQKTVVEEKKISAPSAGAYTIQVASFKSSSFAQKEAQVLKKKGINTVILSKGSYTILCAGNFTSKKEAQPMLSELQKRYQGCYIRRL